MSGKIEFLLGRQYLLQFLLPMCGGENNILY